MSRTYRAPRRAAQAAASREAILEAAARRFARDGYGATTLAAVAEEAGLAVETVYKHFGSKPKLLQRLLRWRLTGEDHDTSGAPGLADGQLQQLRSQPDPLVRLRVLAAFVTDLYGRSAVLQRIFREAAGTDGELQERWQQNRQRRLDDTRAVMELFAEEGSLAPRLDEAIDVAWAIASPEVYLSLVEERGWTAERYECWLLDTLRTQLLAASLGAGGT
jgi:AcrR family transcriptional regulator